MICPYCNKEMECGVIQSPNELNWREKKRFLIGTEFNGDAIVLSPGNFISFFIGSTVIAFNCLDCKKILIDYENTNCDANKKRKS